MLSLPFFLSFFFAFFSSLDPLFFMGIICGHARSAFPPLQWFLCALSHYISFKWGVRVVELMNGQLHLQSLALSYHATYHLLILVLFFLDYLSFILVSSTLPSQLWRTNLIEFCVVHLLTRYRKFIITSYMLCFGLGLSIFIFHKKLYMEIILMYFYNLKSLCIYIIK